MRGLSLGSRLNKALLLAGGFVVMGRARPAGKEHGRYTPPSKPEPIEGSAGWGQAQGARGSKEGVPSDSSQLHMPASHPTTDVRGHLTKWPRDQRMDIQAGHRCWQHTMPLGPKRERLLTYPSSLLQRFLNLWVVSDSAKWLLPISFCLTSVPCKRL